MVPAYGVIVGGSLGGWCYSFERMAIAGDRAFMLVQATPPAWPFRSLVRLEPGDFSSMVVAPGAQRVAAIDVKKQLEELRKP